MSNVNDWDNILNARENPIDNPTVKEAQRGLNIEAKEIADKIPLGNTTSPEMPSILSGVVNEDYALHINEDAPEAQYHIARAVINIGNMLLDKNRKYGNSALEPLRVHSQATPIEQLKVRADDKLSRLRSAQDDDAEDALLDYIGYMIILYIAEKQND